MTKMQLEVKAKYPGRATLYGPKDFRMHEVFRHCMGGSETATMQAIGDAHEVFRLHSIEVEYGE